MHTTLALSGAERLSNSIVVDQNIKQEIVRQKLDAISIIKAHLGGETLAESIIAGVATLANVAVSPLLPTCRIAPISTEMLLYKDLDMIPCSLTSPSVLKELSRRPICI